MTPSPPADLALRTMTEVEWVDWSAAQSTGYVEQMVSLGGRSRAEAEAKAATDSTVLLPDGSATAGNHFLVAEAGGERVGTLWLAERDNPEDGRLVWIYDIEIEASSRRRGHGRALMLLAEQVVRDLGYDRIGLNVFAGNAAAIALYASLGYEVTLVHDSGQNMVKAL